MDLRCWLTTWDKPREGRPSKLSNKIQMEIRRELSSRKQGWTTDQVSQLIAERGNVRYHFTHIHERTLVPVTVPTASPEFMPLTEVWPKMAFDKSSLVLIDQILPAYHSCVRRQICCVG